MDEYENQALGAMGDEAMALIERSGSDVLWVETERGILVIAANTNDPERVCIVNQIKRLLGERVDGETVQ